MTNMNVPGVPYHRLGATGPTRWWRPIVDAVGGLALLALIGLVVACGGIAAAAAVGGDGPASAGPLVDLAGTLVTLALATPAVFLAARWIQRRRPGTVSSVVGRLRLPWLGICLLVALPAAALLLAGAVGVTLAVDGGTLADAGFTGWVGWREFAIPLVVLTVLVPFQAAGEEYLFRGWFVQSLGRYRHGKWPAFVVSAVLFAFAHGVGTVWGFIDLVAFGVVAGWLTVRTGGLEAAIATHAVTNLMGIVILAATGNLGADATAADMTWPVLLVNLVVLGLYSAAIHRLAARRDLTTLAAAPVPSAVEPPLVAAGPVDQEVVAGRDPVAPQT